MSHKKEAFTLLLALIMTGALLFAGASWFLSSDFNPLVIGREPINREAAGPQQADLVRTSPTISLEVTETADTLVAGKYDSSIMLWDLARQSSSVLERHRGRVNALVWVGGRLVSGSGDGSIRTWDLSSAYEIQEPFSAGARVLSLTPIGDRAVAAGYSDGQIRIWDVVAGNLLQSFVAHADQISSLVATSTAPTQLISGSHDGSVKIWNLDADPATLVHRFEVGSKVNAVALHPNEAIAVSGDYAGQIRFWNLATESEETERSLPGHTFIVGDVEFSPNGNLLASTGYDERVKIWDVQSGEEVRTFDFSSEQAGFVFTATFLPGEDEDLVRLATAGYDGVIRLLNVNTGEIDYLCRGC